MFPLLVALILQPAVAGRRRPIAPPVQPAAAVAPPSAGPYDDRLVRPSMEGTIGALDLETLVRSRVEFSLETDMSPLATRSSDDVRVLMRQLAADPRWRVTREAGATVAFARASSDQHWVVDRTGFHDVSSEPWRVALRFDPWPAGHPWATSDLVSRTSAATPRMALDGFTMKQRPWSSCLSTALSVQGERLALELFECSNPDDRPHTATSVVGVPSYVQGVLGRASDVQSQGYSRLFLPRNEPQKGQAAVKITSPARGALEVLTRINPGRPGWTWVRILDGHLRPWEEAAVGAGSTELLGWSDAPDEQFYGHGTFPVPTGPAFSGSVEVWFTPLGGGQPERLASFLARIPAR